MSEQVNIINSEVNENASKVNNFAVINKSFQTNTQANNVDECNVISKSQSIQYIHEYIKRTGECSIFPELVKYLKNTEFTEQNTSAKTDRDKILSAEEKIEVSEAKSNSDNPETLVAESEHSQKSDDKEKLDPLQRVEMTRGAIANNCLEMIAITHEVSQHLRVGDRSRLTTRDLYRAAIQPIAIPGDEGLMYLRKRLDEEKYQLAKNIKFLLEMSRTCCNCRNYDYYIDGNGGMELHSMDETAIIVKLARDLRYFLAYIQEEAKISKMEKDLRRVYDPAVYFLRLHQYLEDLPQTANNLVDAIATKLVK